MGFNATGFVAVVLPPTTIREIGDSCRIEPALVKIVYAVAISSGDASNTRGAIDGTPGAGVPTPKRFQNEATRSNPVASAVLIATIFREGASAWRSVTGPP